VLQHEAYLATRLPNQARGMAELRNSVSWLRPWARVFSVQFYAETFVVN